MTTALQLEVAVECPLCGYDLRGLERPRCPECGFESSGWQELHQLIEAQHPYLFEHQRRPNARSFFRTLAESMLPLRFWRTIRPTHAIHIRRLLVFWVLIAFVVLVALSSALGVPVYQYYAERDATQRQMSQPPAVTSSRKTR